MEMFSVNFEDWKRVDAFSPWLCRLETNSHSIVRLVGLAIGRGFLRPRGAVQSACCARLASRVLKHHSACSLDPSTGNVQSIVRDVSPFDFTKSCDVSIPQRFVT